MAASARCISAPYRTETYVGHSACGQFPAFAARTAQPYHRNTRNLCSWPEFFSTEMAAEKAMLSTILIIILILILIGALPSWGYSRNWGYGPGGLIGVILVIVLILALMGRI